MPEESQFNGALMVHSATMNSEKQQQLAKAVKQQLLDFVIATCCQLWRLLT